MSGILRGFLVISLLLIEYVLNRTTAIVILHGARSPRCADQGGNYWRIRYGFGTRRMVLVLKDWHGYTHNGLGSQGGI